MSVHVKMKQYLEGASSGGVFGVSQADDVYGTAVDGLNVRTWTLVQVLLAVKGILIYGGLPEHPECTLPIDLSQYDPRSVV